MTTLSNKHGGSSGTKVASDLLYLKAEPRYLSIESLQYLWDTQIKIPGNSLASLIQIFFALIVPLFLPESLIL